MQWAPRLDLGLLGQRLGLHRLGDPFALAPATQLAMAPGPVPIDPAPAAAPPPPPTLVAMGPPQGDALDVVLVGALVLAVVLAFALVVIP